jgi:hypothetical protein
MLKWYLFMLSPPSPPSHAFNFPGKELLREAHGRVVNTDGQAGQDAYEELDRLVA